MDNRKYLFTSESVSEGHPDKIADQVSDAVLDACLAGDPMSRVACETFTTTGMVLVGGEITTKSIVDYQEVIRGVVKRIGYDKPEYGLDYDSMAILNTIHSQSPDISQGVSGVGLKEFEGQQGAGDQGMMFGFACNETAELMPAPIKYAHEILEYAAEIRKTGKLTWLRPDSKSQVTIEYDGYKPIRIDTVVVSHQHDENIGYEELKNDIISKIIKPVLEPTGLLTKDTKYFVNPTGRFVIGGPHGDSGLTGRKIIVDTYGGMGRHGGGAFSGKDPTKVDRSAAYMARYVAKNVVAAGLCDRCEVQLAYAIGVPFPVSVMVETFETAKVPEQKIEEAVKKVFDLTPGGIIKTLDLRKPIFEKTASYGHFGRKGFSWENIDKVSELQKEAGK
ncbi:MAG TPA: methionine adenosyltransferase [Spirochaetota bacterium]|nr:methionine adenosyltransferase [Spirochaetota bacterium]HQF76792.1 methionine adenosyltransferase [Spirochaetota bacterium]HQH29942.1 methionine adenosyltransferase [Spirochaetota bacterium]HQJ06553.1 methionine adenosyltransferase [Spirochaetota bacterium]HRU44329.1 methionine adenosyltransferase [Spirochaetota bacterium]